MTELENLACTLLELINGIATGDTQIYLDDTETLRVIHDMITAFFEHN